MSQSESSESYEMSSSESGTDTNEESGVDMEELSKSATATAMTATIKGGPVYDEEDSRPGSKYDVKKVAILACKIALVIFLYFLNLFLFTGFYGYDKFQECEKMDDKSPKCHANIVFFAIGIAAFGFSAILGTVNCIVWSAELLLEINVVLIFFGCLTIFSVICQGVGIFIYWLISGDIIFGVTSYGISIVLLIGIFVVILSIGAAVAFIIDSCKSTECLSLKDSLKIPV